MKNAFCQEKKIYGRVDDMSEKEEMNKFGNNHYK